MNNEIQIAPDYEIEQVHDDTMFGKMAQGGTKFLPRLQLFGGNSDAVKEGLVPIGTYGLVLAKGKLIPLGKEVDLIAWVWRPKAIDMSDRDNIVAIFDPTDPVFTEIQERAGETDSGCSYGPEFLIYLPQQERFATLLFGSKSARMEAPNLKGRLGKPTTLTVDLVKKGKYSWHVIVVNQCSTPFNWPAKELVQEQVTTFNKPPKILVEESDVETTGRVV